MAAKAQVAAPQDSANIYYQALQVYCSQQAPKDGKPLLLEEDGNASPYIPASVNGYAVEKVSTAAIVQHLKKTPVLQVIRIAPMKLDDGVFSVSITPFNISPDKKGGLRYVNSGGMTINFKYDCEKKLFSVVSILTTGV